MVTYTSADLEAAVKSSRSFAGVIRALGLKQGGGTQVQIKSRILRFGFDTSHFTGQSWHKGDVTGVRTPPEEVLVLSPPGAPKTRTIKLRQALLTLGEPHECRECGMGPEWNGKPITLEIDHIDGMWLNNLRENLRFLCPNCHSQQETTNRPWKSRMAVVT